jgi:hypothetical protein
MHWNLKLEKLEAFQPFLKIKWLEMELLRPYELPI